MKKFYLKAKAGRYYFAAVAAFFFSGVLPSFSQQMPQVAQFMFNQLIYNPAAAGMHETQFNTNLLARFQWSSVDGAPITNMLWSDYRFAGKNMAAGLNVNFDSYGANRTTDLLGNYAYYVPLSGKLKLSMGLRLGASFNKFSAGQLQNVWDPDDPVVAASDRNTVLPKAGTGFQLSSRNFYVGLALPDLIVLDKNDIYGNKERSFFGKRRNYLLMGGCKWKLNDSYSLYPNLRMVVYPGSDPVVDINLIGEITDYFWAGATYSVGRSYALMAGTHISSRVRFGYAYEFIPKNEMSLRLNTHEVNLMISLDDLFRRSK